MCCPLFRCDNRHNINIKFNVTRADRSQPNRLVPASSWLSSSLVGDYWPLTIATISTSTILRIHKMLRELCNIVACNSDSNDALRVYDFDEPINWQRLCWSAVKLLNAVKRPKWIDRSFRINRSRMFTYTWCHIEHVQLEDIRNLHVSSGFPIFIWISATNAPEIFFNSNLWTLDEKGWRIRIDPKYWINQRGKNISIYSSQPIILCTLDLSI